MKMAGLQPGGIAQRQINAVNAAGQAYQAGVKAVQVAPSQLAVANQAGYLAGVQAAVTKWAAKLGKVTLQDWQNACIQKGAARLGPGIQAAQAKIVAFWTAFLPILQNAQQQVKNMPKSTYAERIARMTAMANFLHQNPVGGVQRP